MILHIGVLLIPRRLIVDGGRVVTLGGAVHAVPRQVRDTDSDAQCRLPVALELVPTEVEVPTGDAVQLGCHALLAVLVDGGLTLLGCGQLDQVAQHVNAGQTEPTVGPHGLTDGAGLGVELRFCQHMTGEGQVVLPAPLAALLGEGIGEAVTDMVMIEVTGAGRLTVQIPEQLGEVGNKVIPVGRLEGVRQVLRSLQGLFFRRFPALQSRAGLHG